MSWRQTLHLIAVIGDITNFGTADDYAQVAPLATAERA
jgi:hypothetical protein